MDQNPNSNWRAMFDRGRQERPPGSNGGIPLENSMPPRQAAPMPSFGYDDGHDPARLGTAGMSPQLVADEAALALTDDIQEYRPWILQRGSRPLMMLHLKKFDAKAGHWLGWQVSYPHLIAVEYVGDKLLSLDFGTRHFVIKGSGLDELAQHLQTSSVQSVVEFSSEIWSYRPNGPATAGIQCIAR